MTKTNSKIEEKIRKHGLWLLGEEGGERALFRHEDMSFVKLDLVDLSRADFTGANLNHASLVGAVLEEAVFDEANMTKANLTRAVMNGASLKHALLENATMSGARLVGALLTCANMKGVIATGTDFSRIYGREVNMTSAEINFARFVGANLSGSILAYAHAKSANFESAHLYHAILTYSQVNEANFTDAKLTDTVFDPYISRLNRKRAIGRKGYIVYRTTRSKFVGRTVYVPGHTYVAPVMSWCPTTQCHPGIHFCWSLRQLYELVGIASAVECYVREGDYVNVRKGGRAQRLRVLANVKM